MFEKVPNTPLHIYMLQLWTEWIQAACLHLLPMLVVHHKSNSKQSSSWVSSYVVFKNTIYHHLKIALGTRLSTHSKLDFFISNGSSTWSITRKALQSFFLLTWTYSESIYVQGRRKVSNIGGWTRKKGIYEVGKYLRVFCGRLWPTIS